MPKRRVHEGGLQIDREQYGEPGCVPPCVGEIPVDRTRVSLYHGREHLVAPPPETVAKAALYVAMRQAGISKVQLAKRLGVDENEIRRLLDPHYGSRLPRIAKAISLLGQRLVVGVEAA